MSDQMEKITERVVSEGENYNGVDEALRILEEIEKGNLEHLQSDESVESSDTEKKRKEQEVLSSPVDSEFRSLLSGESLFDLDDYQAFRDNLVEEGVIDGEEEVLLITRSEAENLGLRLRKNAKHVVMVQEPDEEHQYSREENWYHVSAVEDQEKIKEICREKGFNYNPVPAKEHDSIAVPKTRSFTAGSIIRDFDSDEYERFRKDLTRGKFIDKEDQIYLLSEKELAEMGLKVNEDAPFLTNSSSKEKFFHVSEVKDQERIMEICQQNGYKYNPIPEPLPDLELNGISMLSNDKLRYFDKLKLYSMDSTSYIFANEAAFDEKKYGQPEYVNIEKSRFDKIMEAQKTGKIKSIENTVRQENFIDNQYNDFFRCRDNNHLNFRHNLEVMCRKEANSPIDAMKIAQNLLNSMPPEERKATQKVLNLYKRKDQTYNQLIVDFYHEGINKTPLNESYVRKYRSDVLIRPYNDVISEQGKKISSDKNLVMTVNGETRDMNLEIGQHIKNLKFDTKKLFGKGTEKLDLSDLRIISASKENNSVTLMDERKNSYIEVKRDELLEQYKHQIEKEMKQNLRKDREPEIDRHRRRDISVSR